MQLVWEATHIRQITSIYLKHDIRIKAKSLNFLSMQIIILIHLASDVFKPMIIIHKHVQEYKHRHHKWTIPINTIQCTF